jgi:hypothetical protein
MPAFIMHVAFHTGRFREIPGILGQISGFGGLWTQQFRHPFLHMVKFLPDCVVFTWRQTGNSCRASRWKPTANPDTIPIAPQ